MWDPPYRVTPSSIITARPRTGSSSAVRRPRKAWILPPFHISMGKDAPSASVTRNRSNRTPNLFWGVGLSRGPRPPNEAAGGPWSRPWRPTVVSVYSGGGGVTGVKKASAWVDSVFASLAEKAN